MKFDRSIWILLAVGITVRCVALNQPLLDAHPIRQCLTAAATKSLLEQPGFHLSSRIPWLGDLDAYYVQELPIYNYLAIGVHWFTGNLDLSGKVTSILLWATSFVCLQFIWRRVLDSQQAFWANLLFVTAPLGVFYGQAFMPEMLVQSLAFSFVLLVLRYDENPSLAGWIFCAGAGLLGLLVKLPEVAHLYLILGFVVFRREGWKALIRPRYLVAAAVTIVALKAWGSYVDSINSTHVQEWTSKGNLQLFIGTPESRLELKRWAMVFMYLGVFVVPGPAALTTLYGLWVLLRKQRQWLLLSWGGSLVVFYLLWFGNTGAGQSYYNLPTIAPLCALFGIGTSAVLASEKLFHWQRTATFAAVFLVALPVIPLCQYLFRQDRQVLAAARWTKENTKPGELVLFRSNHRWDLVDYPYNPMLAYYSERPTFVWTRSTPETYRRMAIERSKFAVITLPQPYADGAFAALIRFRGSPLPQPESTDWLEQSAFQPIVRNIDFVVFKRE